MPHAWPRRPQSSEDESIAVSGRGANGGSHALRLSWRIVRGAVHKCAVNARLEAKRRQGKPKRARFSAGRRACEA
jgi:hypothetical protein